jgi:cell division transport system permease protein
MRTWAARHAHALVSSVGHLARNPFATGMTVIVMGLALALPLGLDTLVTNVRAATGDFSQSVGLTAYLKLDVTEQRARQLAQTARSRRGVGNVTLVTASQGLADFRKQSGFGAALDALTDNPLPAVLVLHPTPDASSTAEVENLRRYLAAWPEVDSVQLDTDWVNRFNAILQVLRRVLLLAAVLLGAGVVAIISNTIRLEIINRRAEIEVTKLVGGSNAFVRRPFLYTGTLYGVVAGLVAWLVVAGADAALTPAASRLAEAYGNQFVLQGPAWRDAGILLAAGAVLGWLGAWLSAARQLARIQPRAN